MYGVHRLSGNEMVTCSPPSGLPAPGLRRSRRARCVAEHHPMRYSIRARPHDFVLILTVFVLILI